MRITLAQELCADLPIELCAGVVRKDFSCRFDPAIWQIVVRIVVKLVVRIVVRSCAPALLDPLPSPGPCAFVFHVQFV